MRTLRGNQANTLMEYKECLLNYFGNRCEWCLSTEDLQLHHKTPVIFGGRNVIENLICLCLKCHKEYHRQYGLIHGNSSKKRINKKALKLIKNSYCEEYD